MTCKVGALTAANLTVNTHGALHGEQSATLTIVVTYRNYGT
jgi:hypothetical protein